MSCTDVMPLALEASVKAIYICCTLIAIMVPIIVPFLLGAIVGVYHRQNNDLDYERRPLDQRPKFARDKYLNTSIDSRRG